MPITASDLRALMPATQDSVGFRPEALERLLAKAQAAGATPEQLDELRQELLARSAARSGEVEAQSRKLRPEARADMAAVTPPTVAATDAARRALAAQGPLDVWRQRVGHASGLQEGTTLRAALIRDARLVSGAVQVRVQTSDGNEQWVDAKRLVCPLPHHATVTLDTKTKPAIRSEFLAWLRDNPSVLPVLRANSFEAVSPPTREFNCIANSVRCENQWLWPGCRVRDFDQLYRQNGFVPLEDMNVELCDGFEKVVLFGFAPGDAQYANLKAEYALYGDEPDDGPLCVHAVVQEKDGGWSSKNGEMCRIKVKDPNDLAGGDYGHPLKVYIRPLPHADKSIS
jgi:hypothetical protein